MKESKNVLHINSYFLTNQIHYNLYKNLIARKADQFLIPVYKHFRTFENNDVDIDYVFDKIDKKLFFTKIPKVLYVFFRKRFSNFDGFHAHTLFSDGLPTYILHLLLKKPFVVSVRNTDISLFIEGSAIFRFLGKKILNKAAAVFFISPSLEKKIKGRFPKIDVDKFYLLPNGLDNFWQINLGEPRELKSDNNQLKLLFVGELIDRKNLRILLDYVERYDDYNYQLHVVGKNTSGLEFDTINRQLGNNNTVIYHGAIYDKEKLKQIYLDCDLFILLSHAETFGVVYIEALSQGLPILYSKDEGLDGFFDDGFIGYACDNSDVEDINSKIRSVIKNYALLSKNAVVSSRNFFWPNIVKRYVKQVDERL